MTKQKYDITIRDIFKSISDKLIKILGFGSYIETLNPIFPKTAERIADLLLRLEDDSLLHIEFQSTNDKTMPIRMLGYYHAIKETYSDKSIRQIVIYIGKDKPKMITQIIDYNIQYNYRLIDIRDIPCEIFLNSNKIEDLAIATLCNVKDRERLFKKIAEKLNSLGEKERADWITKILTILGLRDNLIKDFEKVLKEEVKMPITVSLDAEIVENFPYVGDLVKLAKRQGMQEGLLEAKREDIKRIIQAKFGQVPEDVEKLISSSDDVNFLNEFLMKAVLAKSINELMEV
jgi:hypothetical protein